ncbi:unnamed protein product [Urochloa decumbens]|uniref:Polyadenylate-binding protein n=1 Tax=Urochloa decumbens TaxID=240449 RepID=A0ABC9C7I2_9POAL
MAAQVAAAVVANGSPGAVPAVVSPGAVGVGVAQPLPTTSLYVGDLEASVTDAQLYELFSQAGQVVSVRVCRDVTSRRSLGYAYVNYSNPLDAARALEVLNFALLNSKPIRVMYSNRDPSSRRSGSANIFIKIFGEYGTITSAVVMIGMDGKSKCFGFINFENPDAAARAVQELNGKKINDKEWYVGRAQKKSEREMELKRRFEQSLKDAADKYQGLNLYLKNLDDSIGDDQLRELFSNFGKITSCKVMRDQNGLSKGSGFVAFSTREEASHALTDMNGKMISGKPLYVAFAQRKEDRKAMLQAQFSQMRPPVPITPTLAPRLPMYPPMAPQQLFYGQAPPAMMPPQAGFGFQQQLVPGMRPGGPHMPNYFVPVVQQGQQGPRPGIRRGAGAQGQQPVPSFQQQMLPRGRMYRYPTGRNMPEAPAMPGVAGGMIQPYDMGGFPVRDAALSPAAQIGTLTSALANATPEQQRTILGENLYPLVEQLEPNQAAKVTGMLLEMDQTEVLHLLESPEALKSKVAEAMDVLRNVAHQQNPNTPTSQLSALSLTEAIIS